MALRLRGGGSFNSMPTTTTLSRAGWSPINGRPGFNTIRNVRSKPRLRITSSSSISALVGLAATGDQITLACSLRDMSGSKYICVSVIETC